MTVIADGAKVITTQHQARLAESALRQLARPDVRLAMHASSHTTEFPSELEDLIEQVLTTVAVGGSVTVMPMPEELTSSAAAEVLGISRPTLLKLAAQGEIASHKVGTHTRFRSADVLAARDARRARERKAFADLMELTAE